MPALRHFHDDLGDRLWRDYGFVDAFQRKRRLVCRDPPRHRPGPAVRDDRETTAAASSGTSSCAIPKSGAASSASTFEARIFQRRRWPEGAGHLRPQTNSGCAIRSRAEHAAIAGDFVGRSRRLVGVVGELDRRPPVGRDDLADERDRLQPVVLAVRRAVAEIVGDIAPQPIERLTRPRKCRPPPRWCRCPCRPTARSAFRAGRRRATATRRSLPRRPRSAAWNPA